MIADQYDVYLFDLDGVIYVGNQVLPGSREGVEKLRELGKKIYFLTNDPRPTRQELCQRLNDMGLSAVQEEVITAGWATADYLVQNRITSSFVIGTEGLTSELKHRGICIVEEGDCQAVVIGYDEGATFRQIQRAVRYIERGARFIATNVDNCFPGPEGRCVATGAIVAAVERASGKRPEVVGKPYRHIFDIVSRNIAPNARTVMVGDNPETDILGAHQHGFDAILLSQEKCTFPSVRDFRRPGAIIPNLLALFESHINMQHWQKPAFSWPDSVKTGVAAVLFNEKKQVLLVKRNDNGLWSLPMGHLEAGETVTEAIRRELHEETGLVVEVQSLIGIYSDPVSQVFSYPSGVTTHFITLCFLCRTITGCIQADYSEVREAAFFDPNQLPFQMLNIHRQWLSDGLANQLSPFIR